MLSPEFKWLDPEPEQLARLADLVQVQEVSAGWQKVFENIETDALAKLLNQVQTQLAAPGIHDQAAMHAGLLQAAQAQGLVLPEPSYCGCPAAWLRKVLAAYADSRVVMLGLLDAEGIWAGVLAGIQNRKLDFLATFKLLWDDEPELAAKQTFADLPEICRAIKRRFGRPVTGVYIFRNEFLAWSRQDWNPEILRKFTGEQTAAWHEM